jgi:hypothetical protein
MRISIRRQRWQHRCATHARHLAVPRRHLHKIQCRSMTSGSTSANNGFAYGEPKSSMRAPDEKSKGIRARPTCPPSAVSHPDEQAKRNREHSAWIHRA